MSVIGYDCEGKPLVRGDQCVLLLSDDYEPELKAGNVVGVRGRHSPGFVYIDIKPVFCDEIAVSYEGIRKLPDDQHKASDQSFTELMGGIKRDAEVPA